MTDKKKALVYIHVAVFLWGFTGILGKLIQLQALQLVWLRMSFCAIVLLPFTIKKILRAIQLFPQKVFYISTVGVILTLHWICFYQSIQLANVSIAVVCLSATAFFSVFVEYFIHKKKITVLNLSLGVLAIVGISLMFKLEPQYRLGIVVGLFASLLNSFIPVLNKSLIEQLSPLPVLSMQMLVGAIVLTTVVVCSTNFQTFYSLVIINNNIFWIVILSLFCTILPMYLAYHALQFIEPFTENIIINLEPVYTVFMSFIFFDEGKQVGPGFYYGVFFIFLSVALQTYFDYNAKQKKHQ